MYDVVSSLNNDLAKIGPIMMDLYPVAAFPSTNIPPDSYIKSVTGNYIDVGTFTDEKHTSVPDANLDYFMVVNRVCSRDEYGNPADPQNITVTIQKQPNTQYVFREMLSGNESFVFTDANGRYAYPVTLGPGEGKLIMLRRTRTGVATANQTWHCMEYVSGDVTFNAGYTLTVLPGTVVRFAAGTSLTMNGTLQAVGGIGSQNIIFDQCGSSDWYGIVINSSSGSSSQINYATIKNADYGLLIYGASPTIANTKINYCDLGVYLSGGAPKFIGNTITYNDYNGVNCFSGAAPSFGTFPQYGTNVIRRNGDRGIYASYSCTVFLGRNMLPPSGGKNSLYENYNPNGYQISILYGSTSTAENNWWGSDPPNPNIFEVSTPGAIDYTPWWCCSDPNAGRPLTKTLADTGTGTLPTTNVTEISEPDSLKEQLWKAFIFFQKAEYDSAVQICKGIVTTSPASPEAFSALNVLRFAYTESGKPGFQDYLTNLIVPNARQELAGMARLNLAWYMVSQKNFAGALDRLDENVNAFSNSPVEKASLFQKGLIYLFNLDNHKAAEAAFAALQNKYPDDPLVAEARRLLGQQSSQKQFSESSVAEIEANRIILQNYPNPFNPETTIRFHLNERQKVRLFTYDLTGKRVCTLVEGELPAGAQKILWDGRDQLGKLVASGVYFYELIVGNKVERRKMTLIR